MFLCAPLACLQSSRSEKQTSGIQMKDGWVEEEVGGGRFFFYQSTIERHTCKPSWAEKEGGVEQQGDLGQT